MRKAYRMEVGGESRACGKEYYGDFCYTEYETISECVECVFCGKEHTFEGDESVRDFTCEQCEAEFREIENEVFEVLSAEHLEFDEEGVILL
jgi:hypothetical protein